jgi:hypothetical protein
LKGLKDALSRTRAENKGRTIHKIKSPEGDNSIVSMLQKPFAVIEKAFLELIVSTRQPFQVVESHQLRILLKLLRAPDAVCKMSVKTLTRKIRDMAVSQKDVMIKKLTEALGYSLLLLKT